MHTDTHTHGPNTALGRLSWPGLDEWPVGVGAWPGVHTGVGADTGRNAGTSLGCDFKNKSGSSKCSADPGLINCDPKQLYSA